jgi:hypothetical protein
MKIDFEFTLNAPVNYANKGLLEQTNTLLLFAPSAKQAKLAYAITQTIVRAFKQQNDDNKSEAASTKESTDTKITPEILLILLYSSPVVDMGSLADIFKKLLLSGVCVIPPITSQSRIELTESIYNDLTCNDLDRLMAEYALTFLLGMIFPNNS